MKKQTETILIADDNAVNRCILHKILSDEYALIDAENGAEAWKLLHLNTDIAAILLDLSMPVMDGYTFLKKMSYEGITDIPVLVLTGSTSDESEELALELGAWDFMSKPYRPQVIHCRLKNAIARSRLRYMEKLKYACEHDSQTDLYNKTAFFTATRHMLDEHGNEKFAIMHFNIEQYYILNSFWGKEAGDQLLLFLADAIRQDAKSFPYCTYGRIEADVFSLCAPCDESCIEKKAAIITKDLSTYNPDYEIRPRFGVYMIDDPAIDVSVMFERATLAALQCNTFNANSICYYKPQMEERILREKQIITEMQKALDQDQFVVYFQPKYNLQTKLPCGAEALVRWQHPERGVISPGEFIPVFEQNGFIGKLDYYVWNKTCQYLHQWVKQGLDPAPISVNISRVNLYDPNLVRKIVELVKKYDLPPRLLNLELTETAYMQNPEIMYKVVTQLQKSGFTIMMDDFGSGYSSLNTLKDIHVDVLKIDMKFLSSSNDTRSTRILASMIRMAGLLDLPVVMEGVESAEQASFLESIGCGYVQGYFFAKPMPAKDYKKLIRELRPVALPSCAENCIQTIDMIWSTNSQSEWLFRCMPVPFAVYEFQNNIFHALRINSKFNELFGCGQEADEVGDGHFTHIPTGQLNTLLNAFQLAIDRKTTAVCEYYRINDDGRQMWLRIDLQYCCSNQSKSILAAFFNDITKYMEYKE